MSQFLRGNLYIFKFNIFQIKIALKLISINKFCLENQVSTNCCFGQSNVVKVKLICDHGGNKKINSAFWVTGTVWLQSRNLKELIERHHQAWSLRHTPGVEPTAPPGVRGAFLHHQAWSLRHHQAWSLRHLQAWSLRLYLTQHG